MGWGGNLSSRLKLRQAESLPRLNCAEAKSENRFCCKKMLTSDVSESTSNNASVSHIRE